MTNDKTVVRKVDLNETEQEILKDNIRHYEGDNPVHKQIFSGSIGIGNVYLHQDGKYGAYIVCDRKDENRKKRIARGHYVRCSPFTMGVFSIIDEAIHDRIVCEYEGYYQTFNAEAN